VKRWALLQNRIKLGAQIAGVRRRQFLPQQHPGGKECGNPLLAQHLALGLLVKYNEAIKKYDRVTRLLIFAERVSDDQGEVAYSHHSPRLEQQGSSQMLSTDMSDRSGSIREQTSTDSDIQNCSQDSGNDQLPLSMVSLEHFRGSEE